MPIYSSTPIIAGVAVAHVFGIVLVIINALYLICSRANHKKNNTQRCIKINGNLAWTLLFLYHMVLLLMGLIFVAIVKIEESMNTEITKRKELVVSLLLITVCNYGFILFYLGPCTITLDKEKGHENIGALNCHNLFGFCNFIVFWFLFVLMISSTFSDIKDMPYFYYLKNGYGLVPFAAAYVAMLIEAAISEAEINKHLDLYHQDILSDTEAVELIRNKLDEKPHVHWVVTCGEEVCEEQEQFFITDDWSVEAFPQKDLESMFSKRKYSFLSLELKMDVKNETKQKEYLDQVETFKNAHAGHQEPLQLCAKHYFEEGYTVVRGSHILSPIVGRELYWTFTLLGLSMPYRWFLYFNIGDVEYKIKKHVYDGKLKNRHRMGDTPVVIDVDNKPTPGSSCEKPRVLDQMDT